MGIFRRSYNYHVSKDGVIRPCSASTPERCPYRDLLHLTDSKKYSERDLYNLSERIHITAKEKFQTLYDNEDKRVRARLEEIKSSPNFRKFNSSSLAESLDQLDQVELEDDYFSISTKIPLKNEWSVYILRDIEVVNEKPEVKISVYDDFVKLDNAYAQPPTLMPLWRVNLVHPTLNHFNFSAPINQGTYSEDFGHNLQLFFENSNLYDGKEALFKTLAYINSVEEKLGNNSDYRALITNKTEIPHIPTLYGEDPKWDVQHPILAPFNYKESNFTAKSLNRLLKSGDFDYVTPDFKISVKEERENGVGWSLDREQEKKEENPWSFTIRDNAKAVKIPVTSVIYGSLQDFGFSEEQAQKRSQYALDLVEQSEEELRKHSLEVEAGTVFNQEAEARKMDWEAYTDLLENFFNNKNKKEQPKYMDLL